MTPAEQIQQAWERLNESPRASLRAAMVAPYGAANVLLEHWPAVWQSLAEHAALSDRLAGAKELLADASKALAMASGAIKRESWEDGPTIERASAQLHNAAENIREFGVDGYHNRVAHARELASRAIAERDALRATLLEIANAPVCVPCDPGCRCVVCIAKQALEARP